jgi:hypothetical protein
MAFAHLPTPRTDENAVVVIDIAAPPEAKTDSPAYAEFDKNFTAFKQALDDLVSRHFPGSMKMKVLLKKGQRSTINYRA